MINLDSVFRREWGPTVPALARWSGDLTVAEYAVQGVFTEALRAYPRDGVPDNAGGWIVKYQVLPAGEQCAFKNEVFDEVGDYVHTLRRDNHQAVCAGGGSFGSN